MFNSQYLFWIFFSLSPQVFRFYCSSTAETWRDPQVHIPIAGGTSGIYNIVTKLSSSWDKHSKQGQPFFYYYYYCFFHSEQCEKEHKIKQFHVWFRKTYISTKENLSNL